MNRIMAQTKSVHGADQIRLSTSLRRYCEPEVILTSIVEKSESHSMPRGARCV